MEVAATSALSGLERAQARLETVARRITAPSGGVDAVSLSDEAVSLLEARNSFAANIAVLRVANERGKTVTRPASNAQ